MTHYYFATDGNWGDHTDLVVIDEDETDAHFFDSIESTTDSNRSAFAEWFKNNDHDKEANTDDEFGCDVCDKWEDGDLDD
jgi:hypothetical protein